MSEVHPITFRLKVFNAWRRGNDAPQPDPKTVGEDIDSICDIAKRLERERDEARERADTMFAKHAEILDQYRRERDAERALADRLAGVFDFYCSEDGKIHVAGVRSLLATMSALAAWKGARSE